MWMCLSIMRPYHKSVPVVETSNEEWLSQISINLNGTFFLHKGSPAGHDTEPVRKIINISSSAAKHFFPGFGAYAASKGGIVSFTHTLSEEVKQYGINVNAIYLGTQYGAYKGNGWTATRQ